MSDVVVLIDREQGGEATLAAHGLRLHAAFKLSAMLDVLLRHGLVSEETASKVRVCVSVWVCISCTPPSSCPPCWTCCCGTAWFRRKRRPRYVCVLACGCVLAARRLQAVRHAGRAAAARPGFGGNGVQGTCVC